jgi:MFS superfamily sulfate permease-like transporter
VLVILLTDLLKGIAVGMACGIFYVVQANFQAAITLTRNGNHYLLRLQKDVSFLNKALLRDYLSRIEEDGYVIIDGSRAQFIDQDILEALDDFVAAAAADSNITIETKNLNGRSGACYPPQRAISEI